MRSLVWGLKREEPPRPPSRQRVQNEPPNPAPPLPDSQANQVALVPDSDKVEGEDTIFQGEAPSAGSVSANGMVAYDASRSASTCLGNTEGHREQAAEATAVPASPNPLPEHDTPTQLALDAWSFGHAGCHARGCSTRGCKRESISHIESNCRAQIHLLRGAAGTF